MNYNFDDHTIYPIGMYTLINSNINIPLIP